jgi:hypothetical protein
MRAMLFRITSLSIALAAAVACAASGAQETSGEPLPDPDSGATTVPEGGIPDDASPDAPSKREACSAAGWCPTELPDTELSVSDIWPLEKHAFAFAESPRRGLKFLEWDSATEKWTFIDDGTQNERRVVSGNVWAPNDDEVYFTLLDYEAIFAGGLPPAFVYHGKRPVPPATAWSWTQLRFDCDIFDFKQPKVWGTSRDDVYLMTCRSIYHLNGAGGADSGTAPWPAEYVDDDPANRVEFFGATGTANEAWFVGRRGAVFGSCTVLLRKTSAGYERVADGTPADEGCADVGGSLNINGSFDTGVFSAVSGSVVGARSKEIGGISDIVRIAALPGGGYSIDVTSLPSTLPVSPSSIWGVADDDLWMTAAPSFGLGGTVVRGTKVWSDAGAYGYSTLAMNGAPNTATLSRIRGTSNTNLWAVGFDRAFHKTTQ